MADKALTPLVPLECAPCLCFGEPDQSPPDDEPDWQPDPTRTAVTIMNGTALCWYHFNYGTQFSWVRHWDHREA